MPCPSNTRGGTEAKDIPVCQPFCKAQLITLCMSNAIGCSALCFMVQFGVVIFKNKTHALRVSKFHLPVQLILYHRKNYAQLTHLRQPF